MRQIVTTGVILGRTNYREADRILNVITPDNGKVHLLARGVRKVKSKLAGGIEFFSISSLSYIMGRGSVSTLTSARLQTHFSNIVLDYSRTMVGYEILKIIDKSTQDNCEEAYYHILIQALMYLNNTAVDINVTKCWFFAQLLKTLGHYPNTETDSSQEKLKVELKYTFDLQEMSFVKSSKGEYNHKHIKFLRLLIKESPQKLQSIRDIGGILSPVSELLLNCLTYQN